MCVIIAKNAGVELPFDKIRSALTVNDDGYGISIVDRGKLVTIRGVHQNNKVDYEAVYKAIDELKEFPMFLHLRYRTSGGYDEQACHPFDVFTKANDGVDIKFMHNGVMSRFEEKDSPYPDSYFFVEKVVRPLMQKLVKAYDGDYDKVLEDELFGDILREYSNGANRFVTYSQTGKFLITNKAQGVEFDGWWASNNNYFNRWNNYSHHSDGYRSGGYYYSGQSDVPFDHRAGATGKTTSSTTSGSNKPSSAATSSSGTTKTTGSQAVTTTPTASPPTSSPTTPASGKSGGNGYASKDDGVVVGEVIKASNVSAIPALIIPPVARETFVELCGLSHISEAASLDWESIEEMVEHYPEVATTLIADLLYELYLRRDLSKDSN